MKINSSFLPSVPILLAILFVLGIILRFFSLSSYPNGLMRDEAFLGYNAYSLLITGRDINGHFMPLFLESFLYTPAGYSYFSIPFIKIFGLSIFSVRFVSAFFGALTIPAIFYLTKNLLLLSQEKRFSERKTLIISLLTAFLITITPWHINLSRTASVSTLVTFFVVLGSYFFARWIATNNKKFLLFSFGSYFISLFFYVAPFSFLPPFILVFYFLFRHKISKINKKLFVLLYLIFLIPILFVFLSPKLSLRMQSINIAKTPIVKLILTEDTSRDGVENIPPLIARSFHNKVSVVSDIFLQNYFSHFTYNYLFRDNGFPERFKIPESGLLYPVYLLFIAIGLYYLLRQNGQLKWFLIGWILLGPVGSGFASDDVPNLQRTLFTLPPILIVASLGVVCLFQDLAKKRIVRYIFLFLISVFLLYEFIVYLHLYYFHENAYRPWYRQDGYKELTQKVNKYKGSYGEIVITDRESAPTIFFLFFNRYDPSAMQKTIAQSKLRDTDRISFSDFHMTQEECPLRVETDPVTGIKKLIGKRGTLYVNSGFCRNENLPKNVKIIDTVLRGDGSKVFYIMAIE